MRFEGETFADAYNTALAWLKDAPECSPRGLKTKELMGCQIWFENSRARLALATGRAYSLAFALAETAWMWQGRSDLEFVERYNKRYRNFSDDGVTLYGAYGPRAMPEQALAALGKVAADSDTRQAVISIYDGTRDLKVKSKDIPCTIAWQLFNRGGKLNMVTTMRSNDIFWGVPYDVLVNTMLQEHWAYCLGLEPGWYLHQSASLHVYERHYSWLDFEFKPVLMPEQRDKTFMRSLAVAERQSRDLLQVEDPDVLLVSDCSKVFCYHHAAWSRRLREVPPTNLSGWYVPFLMDMYV